MRGLELVGNELIITRLALESDADDARFVRDNPGMFTLCPMRDVYIMKPWASSSGFLATKKGGYL